MKITTLKDSPQYIPQTQALIEQAFGYTEGNKFSIDFYPLYNKKNFHNCFIALEDNQVVAHIGCREVAFDLGEHIPVNMFGGIAVKEEVRGKGYFKKLFQYALEQYSQVALSFLWSDKLELYEKFQFYPCLDLNQYSQLDSASGSGSGSKYSIEQTKLAILDPNSLNQLAQIYTLSEEIRLVRDTQAWQDLCHIDSAQLYLIKKGDVIVNYFIKNKGQDLQNIIHEYGYLDEEQLPLMRNHGIVWSAIDQNLGQQKLYGSVVKIQDESLFKSLVENISNIKMLELSESEITVQIADEIFTLSQKDFLAGFFGPNHFKEIESEPLFISGLDSI